jgi:hypothetical protein
MRRLFPFSEGGQGRSWGLREAGGSLRALLRCGRRKKKGLAGSVVGAFTKRKRIMNVITLVQRTRNIVVTSSRREGGNI